MVQRVFRSILCLLCVFMASVSLQAQTDFTFYPHYENFSIEELQGKTIKRVVPTNDGKYLYILAHAPADENGYKEPTLIVYDHVKKEVKETLKTYFEENDITPRTFVSSEATGDISFIGNIDVTSDGYLVAITESNVPYDQSGVYLHYWDNSTLATGTSKLFDKFSNASGFAQNGASLPKNDNISGNADGKHWNGNLDAGNICAEAFSWKGKLDASVVFFSSRVPNGSDVRWVRVGVQSGKGFYNKKSDVCAGANMSIIAYPRTETPLINQFLFKATGVDLQKVTFTDDNSNSQNIPSIQATAVNGVLSSTNISIFKHGTTDFVVGYNGTDKSFSLATLALNTNQNDIVFSESTSYATGSVGEYAFVAGCSEDGDVSVFLVGDNGKIAKYSTKGGIIAEPNSITLVAKKDDASLVYDDVTITANGLTQNITFSSTEDVTVTKLEGWNDLTGGTLRVTMEGNTTLGTKTGTITLTSGEISTTIPYTLIVNETGILAAPFLESKGVDATTQKAVFTWNALVPNYEIQKQTTTGWEAYTVVRPTIEAGVARIECPMDGATELTLRVRACVGAGKGVLSDWSNSATVTYTTSGFNLLQNYKDLAIPELGTNKTIKRVVPAKNTDYLYILAHHQDNESKWVSTLVCYNHKTKAAYTLNTPAATATYKSLSDIDVSDDGYIVGMSEGHIPQSGTATNASVYKWAPNSATAVVENGANYTNWFSAEKGAGTDWNTGQYLGEAIAYTGNVATGNGWLYYTVEQDQGDKPYVRFVRYPIKEGKEQTPYFNMVKLNCDGSAALFLETDNDGIGENNLILNETDQMSGNNHQNRLYKYTGFANVDNTAMGYTESSTTYDNLFAGTTHTPVFEYEDKYYMVGATSTGIKVADVANFTNPSAAAVTLSGATFPTSLIPNVDVAAGTAFDEHHLGLFVVNGTTGTITKYSTKKDVVYDCVFVGGTEGKTTLWSEAGNWTGGVPTSTEANVLIKAPCEVDAAGAVAGAIALLETETETETETEVKNTLTILPNASLTVQGTIRKVASEYVDAERLPIAEGDLHVQSDATSQGVLAQFDETGTTAATVELYGIQANGNGKWQYVAMPFHVGVAHEIFQDSWVMYYENDWKYVTGYQDLPTFKGYLLTQDEPKNYIFTGNLPAAQKQIIDGLTPGSHLLGNSWTAPLQIANFKAEDFKNVEATIYTYAYQEGDINDKDIFDETKQKWAGDYIETSINFVDELAELSHTHSEGKFVTVINPLQSFFVKATNENASITLDYSRLVSNTGQHTQHSYRKASQEGNDTEKQKMMITVTGNDKFYSNLHIFAHTDYTYDFDNGYDARKMRGDAAIPYLAAATNDGDMAILATPEIDGTFLNFERGDADTYTFTFQYDGATEYQLEDKIANEVAAIRTGSTYTFTPSDDDSHRFRIVKAQRMPDFTTDAPTVWATGKSLYMTNPLGVRTQVTIYSLDGKLIQQTTTTDAILPMHVPHRGVYIIQVRSELGTQTIKHIM